MTREKRSRLGVATHLALGAGAAVLVLAVVDGPVRDAQAQGTRAHLNGSMMPLRGPRPLPEPVQATLSITAPAVILVTPSSEARLEIAVGPPAAIPPASFLRLRGLPPYVALSEGHAVASGVWSVPLRALSALRAVIPAGASGRTEFSISLVTIDGEVVAETKSALMIGAAGLIAPQATRRAASKEAPMPRASVARVTPPPPQTEAKPEITPALPTPPALSADAQRRATGLLARGAGLLGEGNLASARLVLERAAEIGLAEAAFLLAETYDAAELGRFRVHGVQPDPVKARTWYERARDLGSREAAQRLSVLSIGR